MDIVTLLATLALLAVTFWYAKTTKDMATTAKNAAAHSARATAAAERSAVAALDAARVAQSQVRPNFAGRTVYVFNGESSDHRMCLGIEATGDAVVVQRVCIRRAFRGADLGKLEPTVAISDVELIPVGPDTELPMRLHFGEQMLLTHESIQDKQGDLPIVRFILAIDYTFMEEGGVGATKQLIVDKAAT